MGGRMSNNPMLHYKPGLTLDTPVAVTMAAADWAVLMAWFTSVDENTQRGVQYLVYGVIAEQITAALYTPASVQGAKAHYYEQMSSGPLVFTGQGLIHPAGAASSAGPGLSMHALHCHEDRCELGCNCPCHRNEGIYPETEENTEWWHS